MNYIIHKLGPVRCPFNRGYICNNSCAWFDKEDKDCRFFKPREVFHFKDD